MASAVGLRKLERRFLRTRSPSVRKQWQASRPAIGRMVRKARPPRKFFPFEKFVSLEALDDFDSNGEARHAFGQIRKGLWWEKNPAVLSTTVLGAGVAVAGGCAVLTFTNSILQPVGLELGLGVVASSSIVAVASIERNVKFAEKKGRLRVQQNVAELTIFLERNPHPQLRQLVDSGKFNMVVADVEKNGFRFARMLPKDQELVIRLQNESKNGGVIVFDKNGKLLRGISLDKGKVFLPEAERRKATERRVGTERRSGIERRKQIVAQPFPERRKFQERRKGEQRSGRERRAPPEERTEHRF